MGKWWGEGSQIGTDKENFVEVPLRLKKEKKGRKKSRNGKVGKRMGEEAKQKVFGDQTPLKVK